MNGDMPEPLPPRIERHFCRLALLKYDDGDGSIEVIRDCRRFFPSTTALNGLSANTGIVDLTIKKDHGLRFGPFNHWLNDLSVPPAIILGLIRESNNNIDFNDGSESRHYIAENVSTESFWIRAPSPDMDEVNKKLRWWAVPAQDKGLQKGEPLPNITIIPQSIPIGQSATIRVIDPEANIDQLVKDMIEINVEVFVLNPDGTNTALNIVTAKVEETGPDKGIFEVGMDVENSKIAIGDQEINIPEDLSLNGYGGSVKVTYYTPGTGEPVSDTADIQAEYTPELVSITVTPQDNEVVSGETLQFEAELKDQEGNHFPGTVTWSVKEGTTGSGEITQDGKFTGTKAGPTTVVASVGSVEGTAQVVVIAGPLHNIMISHDAGTGDVTTKAGEPIKFTARCEDEYGNEIGNILVDWISSNVQIGTINVFGIFNAVHDGVTSIHAGKGMFLSNFVKVTVTPGSPSKFICSAVNPAAGIETATITATLTDDNDNPISGAKIVFEATLGIIPSDSTTNDNGLAEVELFYPYARIWGVMVSTIVTATYTEEERVVNVEFTPKPAQIVCRADPSNTTGKTSTITATLTDKANNDPIQEADVKFSTTKGKVDPTVNMTNDGGETRTVLTSEDIGTAKVTAEYGDMASDSDEVEFTSPQTMGWECIDGKCVEVMDGQYDTLQKCEYECKPKKWKCVQGDCKIHPDGTHDSYAKCMEECGGQCPGPDIA